MNNVILAFNKRINLPFPPTHTQPPLIPIHFIHLPSNLNLKSLLKEKGIKDRWFYHYAFIISSIAIQKFRNKKYTKESFVPLNVDVLRTIISQRNTVKFLRQLESWGVIECDHNKVIGSKSYGYRIKSTISTNSHTTPPYSDTFLKIKIEDKLINKKMNTWFYKQMNDAYDAGEDYFHLFLFMQKINIKRKEAIAYVNKNYVPFTDDHTSRMLMIELIKDDIFFKIDKKGNRAHTNLTNLASDLRQFITYKGKRLAQVDLKNSQPFLFNLLIKKRINWSNKEQVDEYNKFKKITQEGKFYEYVMDKFGVEEEKRKEFKTLFFGRVFFDVNRKELKKEEQKFKEIFPFIFSLIRDYKEDDYTNLAIQLQRAESEVIIGECIRKIRIERPDMFVSTIHDSIVVEPENLMYVKQIMLDIFELKHNLIPSVKQEIF